MNGRGSMRGILGGLAGVLRKGSPGEKSLPAVLVVGRPELAAQAAAPDWRLLTAHDLAEAEALSAAHEVAAALCERDSPGVDWKRAVPALAAAPSRPCVMLLTNSEDCGLWDQVTAAGGYDVVRKPVSSETLSRAIGAAIAHWRNARALDAARKDLAVRQSRPCERRT